jgi:hypothetical protein
MPLKKIPKANEQVKKAIQRAGTSLVVVGTYNFASNRLAASKFLADWSNICKWMQYLHLRCVLAPGTYGKYIMLSSIYRMYIPDAVRA